MALTYQTEYCLGRGRRVARTYRGIPALVAIAADLTLALIFGAFSLVFWVISWAFRLVWHLFRLVVLVLRDVILTLARFVRDVITLPWRMTRTHSTSPANKPAWASFREL
jgi:hypothetical protein